MEGVLGNLGWETEMVAAVSLGLARFAVVPGTPVPSQT